MCSEYIVKTTAEEIAESIDDIVKIISKEKSWNKRIKMSLTAPLIEKQNGELVLTEGVFPTPSPFPNSRMSDLKVNRKTGEEELVRIYDVPSWKEGFAHAPCLIPMSSFIEPVYWGENIGAAMNFSSKKDPVLFVAGLRMIRNPKLDKRDAGFSLITHTASEQMLQYHHRLVALIEPKQAIDWLDEDLTPQERFNYLLKNRYVPEFEVEKDRMMAKKPQSRIDEQNEKLKEEMRYRQFLEDEMIGG